MNWEEIFLLLDSLAIRLAEVEARLETVAQELQNLRREP